MNVCKICAEEKPTHVYIGRKDCGCCVAVTIDRKDRHTARNIAEFVCDGLAVDRILFAHYQERVTQEEGFMGCVHGQQSLPYPENNDEKNK